MGGEGTEKRRRVRFAHSPSCVLCRVLSSRGATHVDAVQPSASRTIEVQFLAPLVPARRQPHVANRIDDSFSAISQGSLSEFRVRREETRAQAESFHLPSFNIADACSVFRIARRTLVR